MRYGWAVFMEPNLVNEAGLPTAPYPASDGKVARKKDKKDKKLYKKKLDILCNHHLDYPARILYTEAVPPHQPHTDSECYRYNPPAYCTHCEHLLLHIPDILKLLLHTKVE